MSKQTSQLILIPTITVHPDRMNLTTEVHWDPHKPKVYGADGEPLKFNRTYEHLLESSRSAEGFVSDIAKRKITKAIDYLLLFASDKKAFSLKTGRKFQFKIAFITLTLPSKQIHDDREIKRTCLNSFLIELQKYHNVKQFVWRAEKQKNGNIHFHIVIDKFVHWNDLRNRWNRIINKLGYVDRYRDSMKEFYKDGFKVRENVSREWDARKQLMSYKRNLETDFNSPNSTDIHSIRKIRNLTQYFIKYMTKNQSDEARESEKESSFAEQTGRVWGASNNLQNISGAKIVLDSELETELQNVLANSHCKAYHSQYFSVFFIDFRKILLSGGVSIFKAFSSYLVAEFDFNVQLST